MMTFLTLRRIQLIGVLPLLCSLARAEPLTPPRLETPYGENETVGRFAEVNGLRVYYEIYGEGPPMLQIHGNGSSIQGMGNQIEFFASRFQVIVADSRGHGKSNMGSGRLTYEQMAEDANALLEELDLREVYVLGWSDGGNVGLLLAMNHPDKVRKLAIMGANLNPRGAYDYAYEAMCLKEKQVDERIAQGDTSEPWAVQKQHIQLCTMQPNIPREKLKNVSAPTLVMAADKDVIRNEHTLDIFNSLPKAQLCIFPGATHMIPWEDPNRFNETVDRFFREPFSRPDTRDLF